MIVVMDDLDSISNVISKLENNGCELGPNDGVADRILLPKGPRSERTHYLSIAEPNSDFYQRTTAFRDQVNNGPEKRKEYDHLKQRLASKHSENRDRYTKEKSDFIKRVTENRT